jgi:hypothetical protein
MTEPTRPLAAAPTEVTDVNAAGPGAEVSTPQTPTFPELVYAHFDWWQEIRDGSLTEDTKVRYQTERAAFQDVHGQIVRAYWCSHVESAVVLTEKPGAFRWSTPLCGFHRESDWATREFPDIASELHRCDELAVRAKTVLTGVRQRICMNLVMASASHLMSLVDHRAVKSEGEANAAALAQERVALARTEAYYREAANGQAQIVYFAGMAAVAAVIGLVAAVWLAIRWASPVAALAAGSIGALVSVVQRINDGQFELDYDVGRPYAFFLGGLRPLIGGVFGMAIAFAFTGGLLHLPVAALESDTDRHLALLVVSFLAGFSERWAQDTLVAAVPMAGQKKASTPASASAPAADAQPDGQPASAPESPAQPTA